MEKTCLRDTNFKSYNSTSKPMVSIVTIAYNLENFIEECIESVLDQITNFKVELVVGEDCSNDNTKKILLQYREKYPHIIKLVLQKKNIGLTPNCISTHNACSGRYIALLDGDDFWTDNLKLQKQVNILESNLTLSGTAHQSEITYVDSKKKNRLFGSNKQYIYTLQDTLQHRKFHTSSLMYRRFIWEKTGGIPKDISSNERAIYPMVAIFGDIFYDPKVMCIYRQSGTNLSSRLTAVEMFSDLNMIPWLKKIDKDFPAIKFKSFLYLCFYSYPPYFRMTYKNLIFNYIKFTVLSFSYFPKNLGDVKYGTIEFLNRLQLKLTKNA